MDTWIPRVKTLIAEPTEWVNHGVTMMIVIVVVVMITSGNARTDRRTGRSILIRVGVERFDGTATTSTRRVWC